MRWPARMHVWLLTGNRRLSIRSRTSAVFSLTGGRFTFGINERNWRRGAAIRPQSPPLSQWHWSPMEDFIHLVLESNLMWCEAQPPRAPAAPGEGPRSKFSRLVQWDSTVGSYGDQDLAMCLAIKMPSPCALTRRVLEPDPAFVDKV